MKDLTPKVQVTNETDVSYYSGGYSEGATPVPISNTEVKPLSADGTAGIPCGRVGRRRIHDEKPKIGREVSRSTPPDFGLFAFGERYGIMSKKLTLLIAGIVIVGFSLCFQRIDQL